MSLLLAYLGAIGQGLIWGIMALGIYITFRILDFADMTCDGSFTLGGCISIVLTVELGMNPFLSLIFAVAGGVAAGAITGILHTKLKIPAILSGILTMISLYSINLRVMSGKANLSLAREESIFMKIKNIIPEFVKGNMRENFFNSIVLIGSGLLISILLILLLYWFFGTEIGSALRATGNNEDMIRALGQNTDRIKILGLVLGNALVALSGALLAQSDKTADVGKGQGAIVIGLASIFIGEVIIGKKLSFLFKLAGVILGSVIYRIIIASVLQLGLNTNDLKLLTAVMVAIALSIPRLKATNFRKSARRI